MAVYGPRLRLGAKTFKEKKLGQYPAILTEQAWPLTHISQPKEQKCCGIQVHTAPRILVKCHRRKPYVPAWLSHVEGAQSRYFELFWPRKNCL